MGKRKTFSRASKYDMLDWINNSEFNIRVVEYSDSHLHGVFKFEGKKRQIRLIRDADVFEIDDANFDRWANSVGAERRFPHTQAEFNEGLMKLLEETSKQRIQT